ncbi:DUF4870 domain-containing protein [Robertkochia aurantiaca]|uniref:DUF4870 domain-containing protein n=1 Tax=Robertkochia aurantiaca TaxID=2873700 RepID=UPI001CCF09ED|nr:DUF4870 domain-containing protein [Robertkochia sp. 3YJGBD-33]
MDTAINKHERNISSIIHISTFSKYFIPFGNFIIPLILWTSNKNKAAFVDHHGKQALNFQISILLYSIILGLVTIPFVIAGAWDFIGHLDILDHNVHEVDFQLRHLSDLGFLIIPVGIAGLLSLVLLMLDVVCSILAAIRANEGEAYRYPATINFIR